jgi:HEAT repeat protein
VVGLSRAKARSGRGRAVSPLVLSALLLLAPATVSYAAAASAPASIPSGDSPKLSTLTLAELVLRIAGQSDPKTRREAAVAILRLGTQESVEALLPVFTTPNNEAAKLAVCEAIAEARSHEPTFQQPLLALLDSKEAPLREAAFAALAGYRGSPVVDRKVAEVDRRSIIDEWVSQARELYALLPGDPERTDRLKLWLTSRRGFVRETALDIIYQTLKKKQVEPAPVVLQQLRTLLNDPEESVRKKVVEILRDLRQLDDAHLLAGRLPSEESPAVREMIYHALGYIGNPDSIPVCVKGLQDPVSSVAAEAAEALGDLCEMSKSGSGSVDLRPAIDGLLELASKGMADEKLRASVTDAMANIADPRFLDVLVKRAGADENVPAIRQSALRGIGRIGAPAQAYIPLVVARLGVEQDPGVREAAVIALGQLGSQPDQLAVLRARFDPKVEPSAAVQKRAWEAYQTIFMKLAPKDKTKVIATWPDEAIRLLGEAQLPPDAKQAVADQLLDFVRDTAKTDPRTAWTFVEKLSQSVQPDRLGTAGASRLAELRRQLQAATQPASTAPINQ